MDDKRRREIEAEERYRAEVRARVEGEGKTSEVPTAAPTAQQAPEAPQKVKRKRRFGCLPLIGITFLVLVALAFIGSLLPETEGDAATEPNRQNAAQTAAELAEAPEPPAPESGVITFTSDPEGATVEVDGDLEGTTPNDVFVASGEHSYRVYFPDDDERSNTHKPYTGTLEVDGDDAVNVWLDRLTAEEIAERQAALEAAAVEERAQAEREAEERNEVIRPNGETIGEFEVEGLCRDGVRERLSAPRTAKFVGVFTGDYEAPVRLANSWVYNVKVDSENGFGALLRSEWLCTINGDDDSFSLMQVQ